MRTLLAFAVLAAAANPLFAQPKAPPVTVDDRLTALEMKAIDFERRIKQLEASVAKQVPVAAAARGKDCGCIYSAVPNGLQGSPCTCNPPCVCGEKEFTPAPIRCGIYVVPDPVPAPQPVATFATGNYASFGDGCCANGQCGTSSSQSRFRLFGRRR